MYIIVLFLRYYSRRHSSDAGRNIVAINYVSRSLIIAAVYIYTNSIVEPQYSNRGNQGPFN